MTMKEILLGDYKFVLDDEVTHMYDIYLHDEGVGWVWFNQDMSLLTLRTDDTDLITLLLLKYKTSTKFSIYPY